jgi:hypothetical protein
MQHRSMARAAAALAISQPAVSKAIADMEHTVGLRLLDRSRQGIEPTISSHSAPPWVTQASWQNVPHLLAGVT